MGEGAAAVAVAERPHALGARPQLVVDLDEAVVVGLDAGGLQPEIVGVGHAPDAEQEVRAGDLGRRAAARGGEADAPVRVGDRVVRRGGDDPDSLALEDLLDRRGDVLVLPGDEPVGLFDHRHPAAEAAVHLRELEADVAAAEQDQVLGQEIDLHHARVGEMGDAVEAGDVGHPRAGADVDEDALALDHLVADAHPPRALEAGMVVVDRAPLHAPQPFLDALGRAFDEGVLARLDLLHVDAHRAVDDDAEVGGAPRHVSGAGAGDEGLGRGAAGVDAGPAEALALDDGDGHAGAGQSGGEKRAGLPGADDDRVERLRHGSSVAGIRPEGHYTLPSRKKYIGMVKVRRSDSAPGFSSWMWAFEMCANFIPSRAPLSRT